MAPTSGRVFFEGAEITGLPPYEIARRGIARSFQITNIFPDMTVFENVSIAAQARSSCRTSIVTKASTDRETAAEAASVVELIGLTGVGRKAAHELSHGDRRRLEVGMSLAIGPQFLMLDEPTSGMSPAETEGTIDLIRSLGKKVTICLIEHKMHLVMTVSDKVIVLNLGEKIAEGTPAEVAANERVQEVYLGTA